MLIPNVSADRGMRSGSKERGCAAGIPISAATSKADSAFAAASLAPMPTPSRKVRIAVTEA